MPEGDVYTLGLRALDTALDRVRGAGGAEIATTFDDRHIGDFHADYEAIEDRCEVIQEELRSVGLGEAQLVLRASAIGARARSEIEREQHRWLDAHGTGAMMLGEACRWDANGHAVIVDPDRADSVEATVARMRALPDAPEDVADAVTAALRRMYPGRKGEAAIPDHLARGLGRTFAVICDLRAAERAEAREAQHTTEARAYLAQEAAVDRMQEVEALDARRAVRDAWKEGNATPYPAGHPEIARVVLHARSGRIESPFPDPARLDASREEVADALGSAGLVRLRGGDADALATILGDRTDQLRAALHYVQNDETAGGWHGDAADRIGTELARLEVDAIRLVHGTREGLTH